MDKTKLREEAKLYFVPFLLGNNSESHKLAKKIYRKYKIVCYILDGKKKITDLLDLSSRTLILPQTKKDAITVTQLIYLAEQTAYTLPLLIPCTTEYSELVEKNREILESSFIVLSSDLILTDSPFNVIPS